MLVRAWPVSIAQYYLYIEQGINKLNFCSRDYLQGKANPSLQVVIVIIHLHHEWTAPNFQLYSLGLAVHSQAKAMLVSKPM